MRTLSFSASAATMMAQVGGVGWGVCLHGGKRGGNGSSLLVVVMEQRCGAIKEVVQDCLALSQDYHFPVLHL